jgi:hypothetical protein
MSRLAFCILASLYLIMPLNRAMNAGERIVNTPNNLPQVQQNSNFVNQRALQDNFFFLIEVFQDEMVDHQGLMLATLRARDAAPFIMGGIPAIAIGRFSGNDPIFNSESFTLKVRETSLRYFFISPQASLQPGAASKSPKGCR